MMGPEVKLWVFFFLSEEKRKGSKQKVYIFFQSGDLEEKDGTECWPKGPTTDLENVKLPHTRTVRRYWKIWTEKKTFFKHRTKTNKVWKSDMPAINKQLLVDKDVSDRLLSNHFRHYNQFGDWLKSRLSDWCSPPRQVFLFRNPSSCIFKDFQGYSRVFIIQGFSRILKHIQGFSIAHHE